MKYSGHCGHHGCHFIHHHDFHHHGLLDCEGEFIGQIPVLRYLKEPVRRLDDLYVSFPFGGQPGDFAFVYEAHCFAYWHPGENRWRLISLAFTAEDLIRNLGLRFDKMQSGHVLMWSETVGGFVPYLIRTVDSVPSSKDLDGLYLIAGKGVWTVENGVVREIVSAATWESLSGKPSILEFQSDMAETDNTKLSYVWNKPAAASNATILFKQGGADKGFFTLNQGEGKVIELDNGEDGFIGFTAYAASLAPDTATMPTPSFVDIVCLTMPSGALDTVTGRFTSTDMVRFLKVGIDPLWNAIQGRNYDGSDVFIRSSITDGGHRWPLKHYASGNPVKGEDLYFKWSMLVRYDEGTDTLFTE